MVETVIGDHWFGWTASNGCVSGLGRDIATHRHFHNCHFIAVRLQKPLQQTRKRSGWRTSKV